MTVKAKTVVTDGVRSMLEFTGGSHHVRALVHFRMLWLKALTRP